MKKLSFLLLFLAFILSSLKLNAQVELLKYIDSTFGNNGIAGANFPNSSDDLVNKIIVLPDNKIIAAGYMWSNNNNDIAIAKYLENGQPDITFGINGHAYYNYANYQELTTDIAIQADGKIVIFGYNWWSAQDRADVVVIRFHSDGRIDSSFGTNGMAGYTQYINEGAYCGTILKNGKILAAGVIKAPNSAGYVVCFNPDGSIDNSFGTNGSFILDFPSTYEVFNTIGVQSSGKIIIGGVKYNPYSGLLVRLTPDGKIDSSFGENGIRYMDISPTFQELFRDLMVMPDDRILVGGIMNITGKTSGQDFMMFRLTKNGDIDYSFGDSGFVFTDFLNTSDDFKQFISDNNDNILVTGLTTNPKSKDLANFAVARYATNGIIDNTFGINGKLAIDYGEYLNLFSWTVGSQSSGKILLGGSMQGRSGSWSNKWSLVRLNKNGSSDIRECNIQSFHLYPNPTTERLYISSEVYLNAELEIFNPLGERVLCQSISSNAAAIDISTIKSGVYIVSLCDDTGRVQQKFLKQ